MIRRVTACMVVGVTCALLVWGGLVWLSYRWGLPVELLPVSLCAGWIAFGVGSLFGIVIVSRFEYNQRVTSAPAGYEAEMKPRIHDWRQDVRVYVTEASEPRKVAIYAPPLPYADLRRVALALRDGAAFSYPGLVDGKVIKRAEFRRLRLWCVEHGWAQLGETSNSGATLRRAGQAAFRAIAASPTPLRSMYSVKGEENKHARGSTYH